MGRAAVSNPASAIPEARDSQERVTVPEVSGTHPSGVNFREPPGTTAVTAPPISMEVATGNRAVQLEIPARWLDRLLAVACDLPIADGEEAVARAVVGTVSSILPHWGVGACIVASTRGAPGKNGPISGPQKVVKMFPAGEEHRGVGVDPTRLFPGYAHERVFDAEGNSPNALGSTLHLASDDAACIDDRAAAVHLMNRAAHVLHRGLSLARTHAQATIASAELRALNSHMVQAEKLASLGQIAAGVVHELNNPLTSIVAYTDYLARKGRTSNADPDDLERLRRIGESAGRMLRFTRDLVTYARPSSETPVAVTIQIVIDQALAFCEHVLAEAGATVERRFSPEMPPVRGMPEQLAQVFVNLVTNACHAMPQGEGRLVISTELVKDGTAILVKVEDNGHGVLEANLSHIFAPFFTTKGEGRGTGLGLSIVKNIIDNHAGEISAENRSPLGTRFLLLLPTGPR